jgi:LmbE family N-acetylglucosaminyl deacetylase
MTRSVAQRRAHSLGTILDVWAHPDDECHLSAGLMALARETRRRVVCVTDVPENWPPDRLASQREHELDRSMSILGFDENRWLDHSDGGVAEVADEVGVAQLEEIVAEVRPDTVITFGPEGMTGHCDHITVGRWATLAAQRAKHGARVLHAAVDRSVMADIGHHFDTFPVYGSDGPPMVAREAAALILDLPDPTIEQKVAALRAQPSQTEPLVAHMGEADYRRWVSVEVFVDAPRPA